MPYVFTYPCNLCHLLRHFDAEEGTEQAMLMMTMNGPNYSNYNSIPYDDAR